MCSIFSTAKLDAIILVYIAPVMIYNMIRDDILHYMVILARVRQAVRNQQESFHVIRPNLREVRARTDPDLASLVIFYLGCLKLILCFTSSLLVTFA